MAFLSEILGRPVTDIDGKQVGVLRDLIAKDIPAIQHPKIEAIVVEWKGNSWTIPYSCIAALFSRAIPLKCLIDNAESYVSDEDDIFLARDVLDKQIIDTEGARVVRVNDLELMRVNGSIWVGNVDVGMMGIFQRMGLSRFGRYLATHLKIKAFESYISWDNVELLRQDRSMRLKVPVERIRELHPADIAEIISDLNRLQSSQLLESFDVQQLANALEEVEPDFQASLVEGMDNEKVADVLEAMAPDEVADLLAELPKERSEDLLDLMEDEEADEVRKLLAYPEDSAGGIMTTEYAAIPLGLTAEQAIQELRETEDEAETIYYVYVIDAEGKLMGVFSLTNLIFVKPDTLVDSFMKTNVISVKLLDRQDKVAQIISKYDLLAVPVVDDQNCLHGIVTADDALDKIIPTAWKKRLPRFHR
jgi:magnesium transporter